MRVWVFFKYRHIEPPKLIIRAVITARWLSAWFKKESGLANEKRTVFNHYERVRWGGVAARRRLFPSEPVQ